MDKETMKKTIQEWIAKLKSGNGDYKKVYVEDYLNLLAELEISSIADQQLNKDLRNLAKKYEGVWKDE